MINKCFRHRYLAVTLVLLSSIFIVLYLAVQQSLRYAANDPQSSMAQMVAYKLDNGADPKTVLTGRVDVKLDADPFIIIYDQNGQVVAGNGYLEGQVPTVPFGVLSATRGHRINSVTWQPEAHVRIASVSVMSNQYYILGGRSLSFVEFKTDSFGSWWIAFWALSVAGITTCYFLIDKQIRQ